MCVKLLFCCSESETPKSQAAALMNLLSLVRDEGFAPIDAYLSDATSTSTTSTDLSNTDGILASQLQRHWRSLYGDSHDALLCAFVSKLGQWRPQMQRVRADPERDAYRTAVVYGLYVDLFGGSDFDAASERLDHIASLGCTCLWLLPVLASPMLDAGFDISDYLSVRAELGGNDAFDRFLTAAHARGMSVIFDVALNHCSSQHRWFLDGARPDSPFHDFFHWSADASAYSGARIIFRGIEESNWTLLPSTGQFYFHRFFACQPDLNYANPAVLLTMTCVFLHWAARGVDGFRLDAVPCVWKQEGTSCESMPQVHSIVKFLRAAVDSFRPGVFLLCEACQQPQDLVAYFGEDGGDDGGDECHAAYHFALMPSIFLCLARQQAAPVVEQLNALPADVRGQWFTFLRVHDELTLEMAPENMRSELFAHYCRDPSWDFRNGIGVSARLADLLANDHRRILLAFSIELTLLASTPLILYGDEFAKTNDVAFFEAERARTGINDTRYLVRGRIDWHETQRILANAHCTGARVFDGLRSMLRVRQERAALFGCGRVDLLAQHASVLAYVRGGSVLVIHNLQLSDTVADVPRAFVGGKSLLDAREPIGAHIRLEPSEFVWIESASGL
jgi:maltose alpha-D-glucosyltransferase/alpha-amylase